jgi:hypothetical protein
VARPGTITGKRLAALGCVHGSLDRSTPAATFLQLLKCGPRQAPVGPGANREVASRPGSTPVGGRVGERTSLDVGGLRTAGTGSDTIATGLTGGQVDAAAGSQPSSAGIAEMNAAMASARGRHANRITGLAGDLTTSSARYDTTDGDGADAVTTVSV